jgi:hypothetical protein
MTGAKQFILEKHRNDRFSIQIAERMEAFYNMCLNSKIYPEGSGP